MRPVRHSLLDWRPDDGNDQLFTCAEWKHTASRTYFRCHVEDSKRTERISVTLTFRTEWQSVRFKVLTESSMKIRVFWNVVRVFSFGYTPTWWRQNAPLKRLSNATRVHGAKSQKALVFIQWQSTLRFDRTQFNFVRIRLIWTLLYMKSHFKFPKAVYCSNKNGKLRQKSEHRSRMTPVCVVWQRGLEVHENREEVQCLVQQEEAEKYDGQTAVTELGTGGVAPCILNIGTRCTRVVTLTAGDSVTW
jgi:hypothetical protein